MSPLARVLHLVPSWGAALVTLLTVVLATAAQFALEQFYGHVFHWVPFSFAVFAAAWYGGLRPGLLALLLGYLIVAMMFITPGTLGVSGTDTPTALSVYLAVGLFAVFVCESAHRARRRAERAIQHAHAQSERLRQREEALHASRRRLQTLLDVAPVAIGVAQDRSCKRITANHAFAAMLGISRGSNPSKSGSHTFKLPFRILKNGREVTEQDLPLQLAARTGRLVADEPLEIIRDDGARTIVLGQAAPLIDSSGEITGSVAAFVDVTRQTQIESALRQSEQRFRMALSSGAVTIFEQDLDLRYTWVYPWDPAFNEANIGKTDAELLPGPDGRALMQLKSKVLRTGRGARETVRIPMHSGTRYYDLNIEARRDSHGNITGIYGAALDITSQKLVENTLKEADQKKDEFLAMLAHELRNPLAAIRYANEASRLGSSVNGQIVETIDRQVDQLTRLIDDLLDVSRITRGKIRLQREHVDAATIAQRAIGTVQSLVESRGHELSLNVAPAAMPLFGDGTRLEQVLVNLLTNAAKYTPDGGKIHLSVEPICGEVVFRVRDDGIGIPQSMLSRVFDLFSQGDKSLERSQGGLGIGLTLARQLVEMHGGSIAAASNGTGCGSEFTVHLPLVAPPPEKCSGDPETPARDGSNESSLRILIVDDSKAITLLLSSVLETKGYVVAVAHDGRQGLEATRHFDPDVVLLDIGLPHLSGHQVARRLRASEVGRELTLIALSGYGQTQDLEESKRAGFDHHLVKPVSVDDLLPLLKPHRRPALVDV